MRFARGPTLIRRLIADKVLFWRLVKSYEYTVFPEEKEVATVRSVRKSARTDDALTNSQKAAKTQFTLREILIVTLSKVRCRERYAPAEPWFCVRLHRGTATSTTLTSSFCVMPPTYQILTSKRSVSWVPVTDVVEPPESGCRLGAGLGEELRPLHSDSIGPASLGLDERVLAIGQAVS